MTVSGATTQVIILSQWARDTVGLSIRVAGSEVRARETLNLHGVSLNRLLHFGPHLTGRDWALDELRS